MSDKRNLEASNELFARVRVAVIETVHIDLIENRTLRPVRRLKSRNQLEMIVFIDILTDTPRIIVAVDPAHPYLEIVGQLLIIKLYRIGIIIKIMAICRVCSTRWTICRIWAWT